MDIVLAVLVAFIIIFSTAFLLATSFKLPNIPGPGISEYLPGGAVHPLFQDGRALTRVLHSLANKYGDVFQVRLGPRLVVLSSLPEDVTQIVSDTAVFGRPAALNAAFSALAPGGIFTMDEAMHTATRKKLRTHFNYSMLESFHSSMTDAIAELCDSLTSVATQGPDGGFSDVIDISEQIAVTTFRIIMNVAFGFGMSREERLEFAGIVDVLVDEMMKDYMGYPIRQRLTFLGVRNRLFECRQKIINVCQGFLQRRLKETKEQRETRASDILDAILELDGADTEQTMAMVVEFAIAGYYSTNQMLAWCIYEMCCHPESVERVEKELREQLGDRPLSKPVSVEDMTRLPYVVKCWKETLRMHTVGGGLLRQTARDVTLTGSGTFIPEGTGVMAHIGRTQTHDTLWKNSKTFNPDRFGSLSDVREGDKVPAGANVPFGVGRRSCAGRFLADYEGPLVLAELYRRFKFSLGCEADEVVNCSCFVDSPKSRRTKDGPLDIGVPVRVQLRLAQ